jgi:ubiquinone/menaquinone biosynthesis C-methylase UbiE
MIEKLIKIVFDFIDYVIARQVPSKLGYGHQIDSPKVFDQNTFFITSNIENMKTTLKIAELAAGRGALAMKILEMPHVEYYLACDIDPAGLEVLQKRIKAREYASRLETRVMNCLDPQALPETYFHIVIADKFLHLLSDEEIEQVFSLANRLLQPGGIFFVSSASVTNFVYERTEPGTGHELYRKLKSDMMTRLWYNINKPYVFFITEEYIQEIAAKTGFIYKQEAVYNNKENYLTVALCKK